MNEKVQELLADWELARLEGRTLAPEELCRECPELLPELAAAIEKLSETSWLFESSPGEAEPASGSTQASVSISDFFKAIQRHGLVAEDVATLPENVSANAAAVSLLDRGLLTSYQVDVLLKRKTGPLRLDRYVVLDEIGKGGMGTVYKALHTSMNRLVAIKLLSTQVISDERKQRFRREIQTVASLNHPNIVTAYDAFEFEGQFILAMELIEGCDLARFVKTNGAMEFESSCRVIQQIALAAQAAHQKGIIHRDIKPSNVLMTSDGNAKLLDLGIARIQKPTGENTLAETGKVTTEITSDDSPIGTIAFMSPEQALNAKQADARSDIYSLGCTFFFLLTGKPPFPRDNPVEVIVAHRESPIDDVLMVSTIPAAGKHTIKKMIAKDPNERFATMQEVADALASPNQINMPTAIGKLANPEATRDRAAWRLPLAIAVLSAFAAIIFSWNSFFSGTTGTDPQIDIEAATMQNDLARWVLNHFGQIVAETEFGEQSLTEIEAIPNSPIQITELVLFEPPADFSIQWLTRLPKLRSISLDIESLSEQDIADLPKLKNLEQISLSSCDIDDRFWAQLQKIPKLNSISISSVDFYPEGLRSLQFVSQLKFLTINNVNFSDEDFLAISSLKKLEYLDLEGTTVSKAPLIWATTNSNLKHLDLSSTAVSDDSLQDVRLPASLEFVSFESCDVGSAVVSLISRSSALQHVYLGETRVSDADLERLAAMPSLVSLDLQSTNVTGAGLRELTNAQQLSSLALSGLDIRDDELKPLLKLNLTLLDLSGTKVTEAAFKTLYQMNLSELILAGCQIADASIDQFQMDNPSCNVVSDEIMLFE